MTTTVFQSDRIRLRTWQPADREPFRQMNADSRVMEHFPKALSAEESDAFADRITARMTEDGFGLWAVELSSDSRFIGFCGLSRPLFQSFFTPCVEIGWRLAHDVWGKGFATEAALAVLSLGFATYHLPEIVSFTSLTNERSQKVMRRIGMTRAGEFDHPNLPPGHRLCRHILYRISAEQHCAAENGSKIA